MNKELRKAYIALVLVCFFWGTTYVAARIGAREMPGLFVAALRQFIAGAILVGYFLARGYKVPEWKVIRRISVQGIFLLCISNGLVTWSVEYISSGLAAIIAALVPLFIALFTVWLSKRRLSWGMIAGLITGFAGVLTIFYDYAGRVNSPAFTWGVLLAFISVLSWSFGTVYTARQKPAIAILYSVGIQMLVAGVIMLTVCGFSGKYISLVHASATAWYVLLYLVVFGSLVAYTAYVFAISRLPPTLVSVYAYINPIVAVVIGWLLLSEKMNINMITGMVITLCGVYLVNRESKKAAG